MKLKVGETVTVFGLSESVPLVYGLTVSKVNGNGTYSGEPVDERSKNLAKTFTATIDEGNFICMGYNPNAAVYVIETMISNLTPDERQWRDGETIDEDEDPDICTILPYEAYARESDAIQAIAERNLLIERAIKFGKYPYIEMADGTCRLAPTTEDWSEAEYAKFLRDDEFAATTKGVPIGGTLFTDEFFNPEEHAGVTWHVTTKLSSSIYNKTSMFSVTTEV